MGQKRWQILFFLIYLLKAFIGIYYFDSSLSYWYIFCINPIILFFLYYFAHKRLTDSYWGYLETILILDLMLPYIGQALILSFSFVAVTFLFIDSISHKSEKKKKEDDLLVDFFDTEFESFMERKKNDAIKEHHLLDTQNLFDAFQIEPYVDILQGDSTELKISVIDKISHDPTLENVALLQMSLNDKVYDVQYFSKMALNRLEENLIEQIDMASEDIAQNPFSPANYNLRGRLYFKLAEIKIFDDKTSDFFLERALNDMVYSLQIDREQHDVKVSLVWLYMTKKYYSRALDLIEETLKGEHEYDVKLLFYRAEIHYLLKDFENLSQDVALIQKKGSRYKMINSICSFWNNHGEMV